jgi:osmoprotectant transport system substrate-binding protein/osmoprotectant transport system permease protein
VTGSAGRGPGILSAALAAAAILLGGAGVGSAAAEAERPLRVASKAFTESVILAEIAALTAEAGGAPVERHEALGGTRLCWDALVAGRIDLYPEYTGTLVNEILGAAPDLRPAPGAGDLDALRAALATRGVGLIGPLGFDDTYALGMLESRAAALGIRSLSDLADHLAGLRFGLSNEFMNRADGWPGLAARYGLTGVAPRGLDHDLAYRALAAGDVDVTDLYTTDAEIRRYAVRVLDDDRRYFQPYAAVYVYRLDARARSPSTFAGLDRLQGRIGPDGMRAMNARAKLDRVPERQVAAEWVKGGVGAAGAGRRNGWGWASIAARGREHLTLVAVSLFAAILVGIPLGILADRRPRIGRVVLALTGAVQTIPSLALLVFMIPPLGIGARPAIAALFVYSLLPIVRNTHAGLRAIPGPIRESATALGLGPSAILWRVELPLALGTILAGIKSAAVIDVGTATLGALIGAGGFGQPIFTGIRLDDVPLILQGAIPASLLALAVEAAFDLVERVLLPAPLRDSRRRFRT